MRNRVRPVAQFEVAMRDGTKLATDVHLPDAPGPFPTLVNRTPYNRNHERYVDDAQFFASHGYAVVVQDVRGRWESEGDWYPFINERRDGVDTQNWAGSQRWSTGRIGTTGYSYGALTQWLAAAEQSTYLRALCPRVSFSSLYHNWVYTGGAFQLAFNARWGGVQMHSRVNQYNYLSSPPEVGYKQIFEHLPLITLSEATGRQCTFYCDWLRNSEFGDYWRGLGHLPDLYSRVQAPALSIGGWYDVFSQGTIDNFVGMQQEGATAAARQEQRLIMGPWIHSLGERGTNAVTGDVDFGPESLLDLREEELAWFDNQLKPVQPTESDTPAVRVFVMGRNSWRSSSTWPLPETQFRRLFLRSASSDSRADAGGLGWSAEVDGSTMGYVHDPADPVPTVGGSTCCSEDVTPVSMGPRDQRSIMGRLDTLKYVSDPLSESVEIVGPVRLRLYAATSAIDTDFCAKLIDIYPDGRAINLAEGILRGSSLQGWDTRVLLEPGRPYLFDIDLWSTANCFLPGHRIGLLVMSSNFPQFNRNLGTSESIGYGERMVRAEQTVFVGADRASHLVLPIVPAAG